MGPSSTLGTGTHSAPRSVGQRSSWCFMAAAQPNTRAGGNHLEPIHDHRSMDRFAADVGRVHRRRLVGFRVREGAGPILWNFQSVRLCSNRRRGPKVRDCLAIHATPTRYLGIRPTAPLRVMDQPQHSAPFVLIGPPLPVARVRADRIEDRVPLGALADVRDRRAGLPAGSGPSLATQVVGWRPAFRAGNV